jgi:hypothetical protein
MAPPWSFWCRLRPGIGGSTVDMGFVPCVHLPTPAGRRPPPGHSCHCHTLGSESIVLCGDLLMDGGGRNGRGASVGPYALMAWISAVQM